MWRGQKSEGKTNRKAREEDNIDRKTEEGERCHTSPAPTPLSSAARRINTTMSKHKMHAFALK